jgi:hypothetical protein
MQQPAGEAGGPSLGIWTQLGNRIDPQSGEILPSSSFQSLASVVVTLYPSCGEAVACYSPQSMGDDPNSAPSKWSELEEEERWDQNLNRSTRRSKANMRRYMVENRLVKMWVLTFGGDGLHGQDGYRQVMREMHAVMKRIRRDFFRGKPFPYLFAPEPHPNGHGWHVNLMLPNVFIEKRQMQRCWGNGNVWYTDFTKDRTDWLGRSLGRSSGSQRGSARSGARRAAAYAAKYIDKEIAVTDYPPRSHRYEVAQGFQPIETRARFQSFAAARRFIQSHPSFGASVWEGSSADWDEWFGPPVEVFFFDPPMSGSRRSAGGRAHASSSLRTVTPP